MSLSEQLEHGGCSPARNLPLGDAAPHPAWDAALAEAADGARTRRLTAVVGDPGTGKSLLLARLHGMLEASGLSVALVRDARPDRLAAASIVLLDDADSLSPDVLRDLCDTAASCVLAGRPELAVVLAGLDQADLDGDAAVILLPPLTAEQTGPFFRALARRDVGPGAEVHDDAVAAMAEHSGGVPRAVAVLAGLAAFAAGLEDAEHILARHVEVAARLRSGSEEEARDPAPRRSDPPPPLSIFDAPAEMSAPAPPPPSPGARRPGRRGAHAAVACVLAAAVAASLAAPRLASVPRRDMTAQPAPVAAATVIAAAEPAPRVAEWRVAPPEPPQAAETAPPTEVPAAAERPPAAGRETEAEADQPAAALPVLAAYHVAVTYPAKDRAAERQGRSFAALLASHGIAVDPPRPRPEAAERGVLFYFAEDAAPAGVVASELDSTARPARLAVQRLSREQPLPGTIEVALPLRP